MVLTVPRPVAPTGAAHSAHRPTPPESREVPLPRHAAPRTSLVHHPRVRSAVLAAGTAPLALAALSAAVAPYAAASTASAPIAASAVPTAVPTAASATYVVKAGDTLAGIARSQNVAGGWQALLAANRGVVSDPSRIYVGQRLTIPGGGTSSGASDTVTGSGSGVTAQPVVSTTTGSKIVASARSYFGVRYKWGGMSRSGVDCSGLTSLVLKANGFSPPRTAASQYAWSTKLSASSARAGDLVFGYFSGGRPGHVGIYIGGGKMIDAPHAGTVVGIHAVPRDARYGRPH